MIKVDISKCTGCRRCEVACSFFHTGKVNNHTARIKVLNLHEVGIDGPVVCVQCKERYCMLCPEKAITINSLDQVIVSPNICTQCGVCEKACPIGAIEMFNGFAYVCDLCGGRPKCIEACTENAITYASQKTRHPSLASIKEKTKTMNPSQKRHFYLLKLSSEVRRAWRKKHA